MNIKLRPFQTPNFVHQEMPPGQRHDGITFGPSCPLSEVDADSLATLCDQFRAEVFNKAGKADPADNRTTP